MESVAILLYPTQFLYFLFYNTKAYLFREIFTHILLFVEINNETLVHNPSLRIFHTLLASKVNVQMLHINSIYLEFTIKASLLWYAMNKLDGPLQ